jgi:hypothetical protein
LKVVTFGVQIRTVANFIGYFFYGVNFVLLNYKMNFSITSKLDKGDYIKVMFIGLYKKPYYIIAAIFGLCLLVVSILNHFNAISFEVYSPFTDAIVGLFLLLSPSLIVLLALNQLKSNPSFLKNMTYTFNNEGMAISRMTFKSEFLWEHIIKQKEVGKFLMLYHTKKFGNFIDKSRLTSDELAFIKSKIIE